MTAYPYLLKWSVLKDFPRAGVILNSKRGKISVNFWNHLITIQVQIFGYK